MARFLQQFDPGKGDYTGEHDRILGSPTVDELMIEYRSTPPDALRQTPAEFERDARLAMAVKLFEMKRLRLSGAALPDCTG
jgi:hypothetical protein